MLTSITVVRPIPAAITVRRNDFTGKYYLVDANNGRRLEHAGYHTSRRALKALRSYRNDRSLVSIL